MNNAGLLELGLVFGAVMALLVWELVSVHRAQRRDAERERAARDDEPRA